MPENGYRYAPDWAASLAIWATALVSSLAIFLALASSRWTTVESEDDMVLSDGGVVCRSESECVSGCDSLGRAGRRAGENDVSQRISSRVRQNRIHSQVAQGVKRALRPQ